MGGHHEGSCICAQEKTTANCSTRSVGGKPVSRIDLTKCEQATYSNAIDSVTAGHRVMRCCTRACSAGKVHGACPTHRLFHIANAPSKTQCINRHSIMTKQEKNDHSLVHVQASRGGATTARRPMPASVERACLGITLASPSASSRVYKEPVTPRILRHQMVAPNCAPPNLHVRISGIGPFNIQSIALQAQRHAL